jgi:hypothetical protein
MLPEAWSRCFTCNCRYEGVTGVATNVESRAGVSTQAARKERLRSYATILELIRDATPKDRDRVLQDLRAPKTLDEAIEIVQRNWVCKPED